MLAMDRRDGTGAMVRLVAGGGPEDVADVDEVEVSEALRLEAVEFWQRRMVRLVDYCAERAADPAELVDLCARVLAHGLHSSGYLATCPVVATASTDAEVKAFRVACDRVFRMWQEALRDRFRAAGMRDERAATLASVTVSILQGALVLSRTARNTESLEIAGVELAELLRRELDTISWP